MTDERIRKRKLTTNMSISIPPRIKDAVVRAAAQAGMTTSGWIVRLIERAMKRNRLL